MSKSELKLDAIDRKILSLLQKDNRISNLELSERVGISAATCLRRVRDLRKNKAIIADVAILNPNLNGTNLTFVVSVTLERERKDVVDAFKKTVQSEKLISQCYFVTGDADFIIIVNAPSLNAYEALTQRIFYDNTNIAKFTTMVSIGTVKFETVVPISETE